MTEFEYGKILQRRLTRDWSRRYVTVMGLGQYRWGSGWSAAAFFADLGAKVTVTDLKTADELRPGIRALKRRRIRYVLGQHRLTDFVQADLVVKNPIVPDRSPFLRAARKRGSAIETDVSFFVQHCPSPVIGVTGTRGKSTTASLIAHLLAGRDRQVWLGGNIGRSPLRFLFRCRPETPVVLELSSWMLESIRHLCWSPAVAVLTNVYRDHLNSYSSFDAYARAKALVTRFQGPEDAFIYNADLPLVRRIASLSSARRIGFSTSQAAEAHVQRRYFVVRQGGLIQRVARISDLRLLGRHNQANALAAIAAVAAFGQSVQSLRARLRTFRGVPERLEQTAVIGQRTFYDDTTATSPDATITALASVAKPIVLIAGGTDKNLDFRDLAGQIARRVRTVVLLPGSATDRLRQALHRRGFSRIIGPVATMSEAVRAAWRAAPVRGTILLSPAAASFGLFRNEFDRGRAFQGAVRRLKP